MKKEHASWCELNRPMIRYLKKDSAGNGGKRIRGHLGRTPMTRRSCNCSLQTVYRKGLLH